MSSEHIKDSRGVTIGYIERDSSGNEVARDHRGVIVGRYDKSSNVTRDDRGVITAHGNVVAGLFGRNKK